MVSKVIQQNVEEKDKQLLDSDDEEDNEKRQQVIQKFMEAFARELTGSYSR